MDHRKALLTDWIRQQAHQLWNCTENIELAVVSGDASFRRYFRAVISGAAGIHSIIAVDSPATSENNPAFVSIAGRLSEAGVQTPQVLAVDYEQGWLMLSDMGDQLMRPLLNEDTVESLYEMAMAGALRLMRADFSEAPLPKYDYDLLLKELELFRYWFCEQYLALELTGPEQQLLNQMFHHLCQAALMQPQVTVHRDYHSRNLMILTDGSLGVIDFQDAVCGPITYDLVSLLRDVYVGWPKPQVRTWVAWFSCQLRKAGLMQVDDDTYWAWFNVMGVQRHLKILGIFARLNLRDGKPAYLDDMPLTYSYLQSELQELAQLEHPHMTEFLAWLQHRVLPRFATVQEALLNKLRQDV